MDHARSLPRAASRAPRFARLRPVVAGGLLGLAAACAGLPSLASPVSAQGTTVQLRYQVGDGSPIQAAPGSQTVLQTADTSAYDGWNCTVLVDGLNNVSVHPGNNLVVTAAGVDTVVLVDVERDPDGITTASGLLTLGDDLIFTLVMGPDGLSSAAMVAVLDCQAPAPPSTITTTTTTVPVTTTTVPAETTTTAPPPPPTSVVPPTSVPPTPPTPGAPPSIDVAAFVPVCQADIPYITYRIEVSGTTSDRARLTFSDLDGRVIDVFDDMPLTGSILYPGASATPKDWPGWAQNAQGLWVPDPSDARLRDGLTILVEVNPTAQSRVGYPPATAACNGPTNPPTGQQPPTLPVTGGQRGAQSIAALIFVGVGAVLVLASRRRPVS